MKTNTNAFLKRLERDFRSNQFGNEDDVKVRFLASIVQPILELVNPEMVHGYRSERNLLQGGRPDAVFQNIVFEFKWLGRFRTRGGQNEALFGRDDNDHGLYNYILANVGIENGESAESATKKILSGIGVGFDGDSFLFARFVPDMRSQELDTTKTSIHLPGPLPLSFHYEQKSLEEGLKKLFLLLRQQPRLALTKNNLQSVFSPTSPFVRESIQNLYLTVQELIRGRSPNSRIQTLYGEWDRMFGTIYGDDALATDFTLVTPSIRVLYGIEDDQQIDSKLYLFSLQTFFNIFLKLLVHSFLSVLVDPSFTPKTTLTKSDIIALFEGSSSTNRFVNNFFETHFLEWFTFVEDDIEVDIVNQMLQKIDRFDLSTFILRPESVQDILEELYMSLIPVEMRHLMGEYFSPDWIVEHVLDMAGVDGDPRKTVMDPACGSGSFLSHTIQRIILQKSGKIDVRDLNSISERVVGFDINPISVVAAKANYILVLFSAFCSANAEPPPTPITIPVFIADSVLTPVVYTEENGALLYLETSAGKFVIPKFSSFQAGSAFLTNLGRYVEKGWNVDTLCAQELKKGSITKSQLSSVKELYSRLRLLHRCGKDSFWPTILRNSFAPALLGEKFDFVVGNPPWIAWKSMSKNYRDGTLSIWKSYGIFEKNAYDKKTTHDDFGMAVTYVSIDQYLKDGGTLAFLLPATFLKSSKGGEGFRKFRITRKEQDVPFCVREVHDFSDVKLFSIHTIAISFEKGIPMDYPFKGYRVYHQTGRKSAFDSHATWAEVSRRLTSDGVVAKPVDSSNPQSPWLTLSSDDEPTAGKASFSTAVLDRSVPRYYTGRKGIEPAGAKGVYVLRQPIPLQGNPGFLKISNDIRRSRRPDIFAKGIHEGIVEETFVYPMLGGRNIAKWKVKNCEFMLVPHSAHYKYGLPEQVLATNAPYTLEWLQYFHDELLRTRIADAKYFDQAIHPFYRLDNVGPYTFAPFKVLWKEQSGSMSAVVVGSYRDSVPNAIHDLFSEEKSIVVDSKVLLLGLKNEREAHFVCGIVNSPSVAKVIDGYAINTNRGIDVLKNVAIPLFDPKDSEHLAIALLSKDIHDVMKPDQPDLQLVHDLEKKLDRVVQRLFTKQTRTHT